MAIVQSWGRLTNSESKLIAFRSTQHVIAELQNFPLGIVHGLGRSYGDVALNAQGYLWQSTQLNRFIHFDLNSGILHCESGVSLYDIQRTFLPQGWMLAVSPGTQMVTVGGAICNDVHGKNHHHFGSFGDHVISFVLLRTDGELVGCSRVENADLFYATIGGIGLTGFILDVKIQLRPVLGPWIETETIPFYDLNTFFQLSQASEQHWEHCVSWLDCGRGHSIRGLFIRGKLSDRTDHYVHNKKDKTFPITPPFSMVNGVSLPLFNAAYFHKNRILGGLKTVHYEPFFYPLDHVQHWNRMYGPNGFYQYQSVVPMHVGLDATTEMLRVIKKSGQGSFLSVLKTFGARESGGLLSFPMEGVTLALDFPNRGSQTLKLFAQLDQIVQEAQGRLYLAKDARMPKKLFEVGYPNAKAFLKFCDPGIQSDMSRRLLGN